MMWEIINATIYQNIITIVIIPVWCYSLTRMGKDVCLEFVGSVEFFGAAYMCPDVKTRNWASINSLTEKRKEEHRIELVEEK